MRRSPPVGENLKTQRTQRTAAEGAERFDFFAFGTSVLMACTAICGNCCELEIVGRTTALLILYRWDRTFQTCFENSIPDGMTVYRSRNIAS